MKSGERQQSLLTKEQVNQSFPTQWMTKQLHQAIQENKVEWATTSGTTSDRLQIIRPKNWWVQEYTWLNQTLYPEQTNIVKRAVLTTAMCSADVCSMTQPTYSERCLHEALYLNIHHDPNVWQKEDLIRMVKELSDWQPQYLLADPVYLLLFIKGLKKHKIDIPSWSFDKIVVGYEYLTYFNRKIIQAFFPHQSLRQLYGSTETGFHILEDEDHSLKCHHQKATISLLKWKKNIYEVIISSWKNPFMPLINYRIGDLVKVDSNAEVIEQPLAILAFQGRKKETLEIEGETFCLGEFEELLGTQDVPIAQYQIRRSGSDLRFIYTTTNDEPLPDSLVCGIRSQFSKIISAKSNLIFDHHRSLSPQSSGKFRILHQ